MSISLALAGNPNCGKTTLYNALTGTRQYVGNWPGVTVEKKEGKVKFNNQDIKVTDLPGTYSLSPYSIEEIIARDYIVESNPDVVVNIVDASNIERNLYLSVQLIEHGRPVVIALNMMDVAEKKGFKINAQKLSDLLGVPVVPIVASKGKGIQELLDVAIKVGQGKIKTENKIQYSEDLEGKIKEVADSLKGKPQISKYNPRWAAIKFIENDKAILKMLGKENSMQDEEWEFLVADERYDVIGGVVSKAIVKPAVEQLSASDKIDKVVTNKWLGIPIFALLMYAVFWLSFTVGDQLKGDYMEPFFESLAESSKAGLEGMGIASWLTSLISDGIIAGVGGVLTFLPNIIFLFIAISILEDSGYMARVAFIMDRAMRKIGLSGKAFIPMIMGFGCSVPAIMGARTLEEEKDRLTAILITPFMSCSARLPIYVLFAGAFFPGNESIIVYSLYILGIVVAITMGLIFKKTIFKGQGAPFVMELPPYRIPTFKGLSLNVWDKMKGYIHKAGTVILAASIILWYILGYNFSGAAEMEQSFGRYIGGFLAPLFAPLGFGNWQSSLSLLSGLAAKEVVVSNMAVIYGLAEEPTAAQFAATFKTTFTHVSAYAFMVFSLLYTPCVAVIGVVKKETNSWKWTAFSVVYQFAVAWIVALIVFQVGTLLGF